MKVYEKEASQEESKDMKLVIIFSHTCEYSRVSTTIVGPRIVGKSCGYGVRVEIYLN